MTERRTLLLDLAAKSRNWALPPEGEIRVRNEAPAGWNVISVASPTSSDGDGSEGGSDEALQLIAGAEVYFGFGFTPDLLRAAGKLRWMHTAAAGVGNVLDSGIANTEIRITNSAGIHGPPIAEFVIAGVLHFLRGLDVAIAQQRNGQWDKRFFVDLDSPLRELADCRVLIVGTGGLGGETARRLSALGAHCVGIRRRPELGPPAGFAAVAGLSGLEDALTRADILILAAPLTTQTSELMTRSRLSLLPRRAIVVNVARGALLDEVAVAELLSAGQLRGAVLDVFREEPLDASSPLWQLPNALVVPHVSPVSPGRFWPRQLDLFLDNWRRYAHGEPLRNLVDTQAGY